jgi:hypothetical protein
MRSVALLCLALGLLAVAGCQTQSARIAKVLPHYLDRQGRHTPAPSLFERDAHQAYLRANPDEIGGLRFDVQWVSTVYYVSGVRLRLELRGSKDPTTLVLEEEVEKRPWYQRWTSIELDRETYDRLGEVIAWRVTLWDADQQLAERQSFLW